MAKLTLTKEEMIQNMYLRAEELIPKCLVLNRRGLVQAVFSASPHVQAMSFRVFPANTVWARKYEIPAPLAQLDIKLDFYEFMDVAAQHNSYSDAMDEMETLGMYLDLLIAKGKRIDVELKMEAAQ